MALLHTALEYSNCVQLGEKFTAVQGTWERVRTNVSSRFPLVKPATCFTNVFVRLALRIIGGGADKLGYEASKYFRINGGEANVLRALHAYVSTRDPPRRVLIDEHTIARELFGVSHSYAFLTGIEMEKVYRVNPHTSCGLFLSKGIDIAGHKRLGAVMQQIDSWRRIQSEWLERRVKPSEIPQIIWGVGTRGKLIYMEEIEDKIVQRKALCRTIAVAEPIEHYLFYPLYNILAHVIHDRLNIYGGPIMIGVRKKTDDWIRLCKTIEQYDYVMCLDWSNFDASIPGYLLEHVWRIIEYAVLDNIECTDLIPINNYLNNCKLFFYNNFIRSIYVVRDYIITTLRGVPSGSLLTSIIGSVINYAVIRNILDTSQYKITDFTIKVYGDDSLLCFNVADNVYLDYNEFIKDMAVKAKEYFGMSMNVRKTRLCKGKYARVTYKQPIYCESERQLRKGTHNLQPIAFRYYQEPNMIQDYKRGLTHRVNYSFTNHPDFLMSYMDYLGRPVSSVLHTMIRLVNPEMPVMTANDALDRVDAAVYDNCFNIHVRNYGFHIRNAIEVMIARKGITWHPIGLDIKAYKYNGDIGRDDDEILRLHAESLKDLTLFYRESKEKVEFLEDKRTKYSLLSYEEYLRKLSCWNDMCIEFERNPVGRDVRMTPGGRPVETINQYRGKGLYALKMISYCDRKMGSQCGETYVHSYTYCDNEHIISVVLAYVKGYLRSKYTVWDLKDLPDSLLKSLKINWYADVLRQACSDKIISQQHRLFNFSEYFSNAKFCYSTEHKLAIAVKRAMVYAHLWVCLSECSLESVMREFYSMGVQDRANEECLAWLNKLWIYGDMMYMCVFINDMITYRCPDEMYDILLHVGWANVRRRLIGHGCDLNKYNVNFQGKLTYVL